MTVDWGKHQKAITRIHSEVNALPYSDDLANYGESDLWNLITDDGDCEDYSLTKRKRIHEELGIPHSDLLLALCWTERDEYHAVLVIPTGTGDRVLDNRKDDIFTVGEMRERGYKFDRMLKPSGDGWQDVR